MTQRLTDEELAREAKEWDTRKRTPKGWEDAPEAIPRAGETTSISLRVPDVLLAIVREFARGEGIGYQVLIKKWLDERVRLERDKLLDESKVVALRSAHVVRSAASFIAKKGELSKEAGVDELGKLARELHPKSG